MLSYCTSEIKIYIFTFEIQFFIYIFTCKTFLNYTTYMGRITLESIALNKHFLAKICVELAFKVLEFEKKCVELAL